MIMKRHYLRTDNRLNALHIGTRKEPDRYGE